MSSNSFKTFLALACERETVKTGVKVAIVVGSILNLINQGDALVAWQWQSVQWQRLGFTFVVPFCVSVYSAARVRLRFDPGVVVGRSAHLQCTVCGETGIRLGAEDVVPSCPICLDETRWLEVPPG